MLKYSMIKMLTPILLLLTIGSFVEINATEATIDCQTTSEIEYQPIISGDGEEILTSKKIFKKCKSTVNVRGNCISWKYETESFKIPEVAGVAVEEYTSASDVAGIMATMEAINRSNVIFSGVKGYCEEGYSADYGWLEDPMFWTGVAMQAISAMGEDVDADAASANIDNAQTTLDSSQTNLDINMENLGTQDIVISNQGTIVGDAQFTYDASAQAYDAGVASGLSDSELSLLADDMFSANSDLVDAQIELSNLVDARADLVDAVELSRVDLDDAQYNLEWAQDEQYDALANQTDLQKFSSFVGKGYSGCATTGALNVLSAAYSWANREDEECDPVDEFCDGEGDEVVSIDPASIVTLSQAEYDNLISQKPEYASAMEIIKVEFGYVTIRLKTTNEMISFSDTEKEKIKEAKEEAALLQFYTSSAISTIGMAACMGQNAASVNFLGGDDTSASAPTSSNTDGIAAGLANSVLSSLLPFPYNTISTVVQNLVNTWDDIDSCTNEDDAQASGSRHVKAYRGLKFNTCHPITDAIVVEEWPITNNTMREGFSFCCYESPLSKILMLQIKSQLGKGWTHCTDVTLNELSHVKFKGCTAQEKNYSLNGGYYDGASFRGEEFVDYNMKNSFQYKYQCIDMQEIRAYIKTQTSIEFSDSQIDDFVEDFL